MKFRQTKTLMQRDNLLFSIYEPPVGVQARTPLQQQRDKDGTQFSRLRNSHLYPQENLYLAPPQKVEKGSLAQKLPDYHHPPQTDPCMTVCDYLNTKRAKAEYQTSYSSVFNDPYSSGYDGLDSQPRSPVTNRRDVNVASNADRAVKPAPRNPYGTVKKCLTSYQDQLNKLIK